MQIYAKPLAFNRMDDIATKGIARHLVAQCQSRYVETNAPCLVFQIRNRRRHYRVIRGTQLSIPWHFLVKTEPSSGGIPRAGDVKNISLAPIWPVQFRQGYLRHIPTAPILHTGLKMSALSDGHSCILTRKTPRRYSSVGSAWKHGFRRGAVLPGASTSLGWSNRRQLLLFVIYQGNNVIFY